MDLEKIGKNIRKIRELRDYDQGYMAYQLGISQGQYSKIEQGMKDISIITLDKIAAILNVEKSLLETFEVDSLLKSNTEAIEPILYQNKKTTHQMVVTIDQGTCVVEPLHEIMYFVQ